MELIYAKPPLLRKLKAAVFLRYGRSPLEAGLFLLSWQPPVDPGHSTMHTWISRYLTEGTSVLSENGNARRRRYSEEIRQKAVEEYLSGQGSAMAIAEKYKLRSGNLVLDWVKEYHRHRNSVEEAGGVSMTRRKHTLGGVSPSGLKTPGEQKELF
ncbi:transposase [Oscillospiraceae bacterium 38-13]